MKRKFLILVTNLGWMSCRIWLFTLDQNNQTVCFFEFIVFFGCKIISVFTPIDRKVY